ncbi:hypothetical protein JB92DRAFT_2961235 [Gautieria morchelliformis]|nr:hypothetical protein JB92DRAFT_2961235 [Gautieria morchelliformis]
MSLPRAPVPLSVSFRVSCLGLLRLMLPNPLLACAVSLVVAFGDVATCRPCVAALLLYQAFYVAVCLFRA